MSSGTPIKLVVVGDGGIGKTCLLTVFKRDQFPREYVPRVFDDWPSRQCRLQLDGQICDFTPWDTPGCYGTF